MKRMNAFLRIGICLSLLIGMAWSTETEKRIPDYSTKARKDVPAESTWKIEDLYANMAEWQKDKDALKEMIGRMDAHLQGWTESSQKMLAMMTFRDQIRLKASRLSNYASNQYSVDMANPQFQVMQGDLRTLLVQLRAKSASIHEDLLKVKEETLRGYFTQEPRLAPYGFEIENVLRLKSHVLPTEQQRIVSMTGLFGSVPSQAASLLNNSEIPIAEVTLSDGRKVALNNAAFQELRGGSNPVDRSLVVRAFWENHRRFEKTMAALLDGGVKQNLFFAQVGKYRDCLEASLSEDNIDPEVYHRLLSAVKANLRPLHRYLALKKQLLGLDKLRYEDIYASAVKTIDKSYTFTDACRMILDAMKPMGEDYQAGLQRAWGERWIDIYPNQDKSSGAYCSGVYGVHPFVFVNYNGRYAMVSILAHELGHAMHSYFSGKSQPMATSDAPTFLAEIASTFNENMLLQSLLKSEKDDLLKLFVIDSYLDQVRGTLYRQAQFADFELAMHRRVEEGKTLTAEWLNKTYLDLARLYYGHDLGVTLVDDYIQNEWSYIPHFYFDFYVYQYSTGIVASMAFAEKVTTGGRPEAEKYLALLKAGGSDYPIQLLKKSGLDMTTDAPAQAAFRRFDSLVTEMEKIVARLKAKGKI